MQAEEEQKLRSSNKRCKSITLDDEENAKPSEHLFNPKAIDVFSTFLSLKTFKIFLVNLTADDDMLSEFSHDIFSLSSETDDIHSLNSFYQSENIVPTSRRGEPELDQDNVQMLVDDALYLEFLRSPSPSLCYTGADLGRDDLRISISSQIIVPADVCLFLERDRYLADLTTERVLNVNHKNVQIKSPRLTLHVRPTKTASKPKVFLRYLR